MADHENRDESTLSHPSSTQVGDSNVKEEASEQQIDPADGLRAWICVVGSFLMHFMVLGWIYSFSLFVPVYESAFGIGRAKITSIYQLQIALLMGGGFFSGRLADAFGVRIVFGVGAVLHFLGLLLASFSESWLLITLTQGALVGLGSSCLYWPAITVIPMWFEKHRGLALGLAVLGSGVGNLVIGICVEKLIAAHGFRFALRVFSFVSLATLGTALACLKRRFPTERRKFSDDLHTLRERTFLLIIVGGMFFQVGYNIPFAHLAAYIEDLGHSSQYSAQAVGMVGIGSAVGRVILGWLADRVGVIRCFKALMWCTAVTAAMWYFAIGQAAISAFSFCFGFFSGGFIALVPAVVSTFYGVKRLGGLMGYLAIALVPGSIIGPLLSGIIYDNTGSYDYAILFTALTITIAAVLLVFLRNDPEPEKSTSNANSATNGQSFNMAEV